MGGATPNTYTGASGDMNTGAKLLSESREKDGGSGGDTLNLDLPLSEDKTEHRKVYQ